MLLLAPRGGLSRWGSQQARRRWPGSSGVSSSSVSSSSGGSGGSGGSSMISGHNRRSVPMTSSGGRAHVRVAKLPHDGRAVVAIGEASSCLEALARHDAESRSRLPPTERRNDKIFALVVAASDSALHRLLNGKALRRHHVVGCVEPSAFAPSSRRDAALVVAAELGEGVEAFTFDTRHGALPEFGSNRLSSALTPGMAPHFIVFAGASPSVVDEHTEHIAKDFRVLSAFKRRVDGLFMDTATCNGVVVRGVEKTGKIVHARRRLREDLQGRASRLTVYNALSGCVGVALLPKTQGAAEAAQTTAAEIARLAFGAGARRLWCAGDGLTGPDEQRMLFSMMDFYHAFDTRNLEAMTKVWHNEKRGWPPMLPTVAHPGRPLARGFEKVIESWRGILHNSVTLKQQQLNLDRDDTSTKHDFGLGVSDVRCVARGELGWATCSEHLGDAQIQATNAFFKDAQTGGWLIAHHHGSLEYEPGDDGSDDDDDDDDSTSS